MKQYYLSFVVLLLIMVIAISGCTSDTEYTPPAKVESTPSAGDTSSETKTAPPQTQLQEPECTPDWQCSSWSECSQTETQTRICTDKNNCGVTTSKPSESQSCTPEPPKIQTFKPGDTATDNELKVTVNSVNFVSKIDQKDNEFLIAEAPSGKQYAIIDLTIENILSDKTQSVSTMMETTIVDQDGYNYDLDFEGFTALDKSFKDGEILPGMKKRGELAYLVPSDATDLKFLYQFDLFTGTTAVFDIK